MTKTLGRMMASRTPSATLPLASTGSLRSRFRGALLGCVIGDAIGRPFETMSPTDERLASSLKVMLSERRSRAAAKEAAAAAAAAAGGGGAGPASSLSSSSTETIAPWRYSDDGEMMISVAESLVRVGGVSHDDLLTTLAQNYDPTRGYSHGMRMAMEAIRAGRSAGAFTSWQDGSQGNGGAVRIAPVVCAYWDHPDLATFVEDSAGTTHGHPLGRAGAVALAMAMSVALGRQNTTRKIAAQALLKRVARPLVVETGLASKMEAVGRLVDAMAKAPEAARILGSGTHADQAVPLAIFCFLRWAPDFEAVITNSVLAGGSTDTLAAMSGSLCGALVGEEGIPEKWLARLESGEAKGATYVRSLADQVFALWESRSTTNPTPPEEE
jgi:poly(ADP-ribose) glycohydrolase ARH3